MYISKKKYNSYFIWLWSQVQKWYTLLGKKLDFAYQKNGKNGTRRPIITVLKKPKKKRKNIPLLWKNGTPSNILYKKQFIITHL